MHSEYLRVIKCVEVFGNKSLFCEEKRQKKVNPRL